jgi:hypothetical protein
MTGYQGVISYQSQGKHKSHLTPHPTITAFHNVSGELVSVGKMLSQVKVLNMAVVEYATNYLN